MKSVKIAFALLLFSGSLVAQDINVTGTISRTIKIPLLREAGQRNTRLAMPAPTKEIKLLKINLSDRAKISISNKAKRALTHRNTFLTSNPSTAVKHPEQVQLGMNGVPVFDQGNHGTCTTFAVTAAIDAVLNKGDYISQLCQLQIGNYIQTNGYTPSGWNGSWGRLELSKMDVTGIISKEQQKSQGCGGLLEYPLTSENPESSMSFEEYHPMSEPMNVGWWTLLDVFNAVNDRLDPNITLDQVKDSLIDGDRVAFGILLFDFDQGMMGAIGKKGATYDSWILSPEMLRDLWLRPLFGGHAMVITGYDDNAIATDDKGREYKGLLTLRNSWGDQVGDHGNFYMSYDYFKVLVMEAQRINKENTPPDTDDDHSITA